MWCLPAWNASLRKKLSGALARTQKPKSYPQEKKARVEEKRPVFLPTCPRNCTFPMRSNENRGRIKISRPGSRNGMHEPENDRLETDFSESFDQTAISDWVYLGILYRTSSSSPDLPTYEAKTHKASSRFADSSSQNCGRKKTPTSSCSGGWLVSRSSGLDFPRDFISSGFYTQLRFCP